MKLQEAVASAMRRLDDEDGVVWTFDEMKLYIKDGYDIFCRRTKCLFDIFVIENIPQTGNWTNDLERYLAEQTPGMGLTDASLAFTGEDERDLGVGGAVGGSTSGPTPATSPSEGQYFGQFAQPTKVSIGRLPNSTAEVLRVTWDELELHPEQSSTMKRLDNQYERRDGGDPRNFTMDKDGLTVIRLIPPAQGDALYSTVSGSWGTMTQTSDTTIATHGTWGGLVEVEGCFPSGGPWGTPTRQHPATKNVMVEIARLGRTLDGFPFEIPLSSIKFVIFWAMHRALKRNGVGQDLKLAKHFSDRFEMGITRMASRLKKNEKERVLKMGTGGENSPFNLGEPGLPYPYGPRGRRIQ